MKKAKKTTKKPKTAAASKRKPVKRRKVLGGLLARIERGNAFTKGRATASED